nr:MAG TPA: hypothetical protein [Caudoviricetes sp.]
MCKNFGFGLVLLLPRNALTGYYGCVLCCAVLLINERV